MDFALTPEQQRLQDEVRDMIECELAPHLERLESGQMRALDFLPALAQRGLLGVDIPVVYGGTGLGQVARVLVVEELARVSATLAMMIQCFQLGSDFVTRFGTEEQKAKFLPGLARGEHQIAIGVTEATGGSDPAGILTTARREGDSYVLNGRKVFITNSHAANMAVVVARTKDGPAPEFSAFLVEKTRPGFRVGRMEAKLGFRGCEAGELIFQDCRVPAANRLGEEGQGLMIALAEISESGRPGVAAMALGLIQASLDAGRDYLAESSLYLPMDRPPLIYHQLNTLETELEAARLLTYRAAWLKESSRRCDTEMAAAKYLATETAVRAALMVMKIMGHQGAGRRSLVERYWREALLLLPSDGTPDIQKIVVAKGVLAKNR